MRMYVRKTQKKAVPKMSENKEKLYDYCEPMEEASFSVTPSVECSSADALGVPAVPLNPGQTISVSAKEESCYCWLAPSSSYFAQVFITVSAKVRTVFRRARYFVRRRVKNILMSLVIRKTVCLRL